MDGLNVTFASLLTPTGVVVAAALVTTLIQLLKSALPALDARISGATLAFILSGILYVLTALSTSTDTADEGLLVFMAWLSCATSAVGIKSTTAHVASVAGG